MFIISPKYHVSAHILVSLSSCYIIASTDPHYGMTYDGQKMLQGSVIIAAMHCIAATCARVGRIFFTWRTCVAFYLMMNACTVGWATMDTHLPSSYFIMLTPGGFNLSTGGWLLLALAGVIVGIVLRDVFVHARAENSTLTAFWLFAWIVLASVCTVISRTTKVIHVHHYMWAPAIALLAKYDSRTCIAAQAAALGIFNQELLTGNPKPFFDNI